MPISSTIAPKDAGIKREKEKLKAEAGLRPSRSPAKIVDPERETPGTRARAWNTPIIKELSNVSGWSRGGINFVINKSSDKNIRA